MEKFDYLFKFIIIGDSNVGKSCILQQFLESKFKKDSTHTIGVEFGSKVVEVGGKNIKLQIWDTAGQERFRSVTRSYYRGAAGAILVYDVSSRESYNNVGVWLNDAKSLASKDIVIMLVGNKSDLVAERAVTFLEASRFSDLLFVESSALNGDGIDEIFLKCSRTILSKINTGSLDPSKMGSGVQQVDAHAQTNERLTSVTATQGGCPC